MQSEAVQDYVKQIYLLQTRSGKATTNELAELVPEQEATVRRVPDGDPELLRYLARLGIKPAARVRMVGKEPFQGPVTIDVEGVRRSLGIGVAEMVRVEPA